MVSQHLLNEREKGKVAERQKERVSVCASVGRHRNSTLRERGREHIETHMVNIMGINNAAASLIN